MGVKVKAIYSAIAEEMDGLASVFTATMGLCPFVEPGIWGWASNYLLTQVSLGISPNPFEAFFPHQFCASQAEGGMQPKVTLTS